MPRVKNYRNVGDECLELGPFGNFIEFNGKINKSLP